MKRTAIYLRVSSDKQAQEGDSIPAQRDALRKYIDDRPDLSFAGEYLDDGISGTKLDRDELQRLLDDVKAGKIDLILVTKLDRWFRSIRHYINTQELLDKHGVGWLAIWEPIYDSTTPQGRLIINQMMSIAQFEAENTGSRINQVFAYKVKQGEVISGTLGLGHKIENKHIVLDENAPIVKDLFEYYDRTSCLADMARYAMEKYGLDRCSSTWRRFLHNEKYVGSYRGNPEYCPAIISKDLFQSVQRKLTMNIKGGTKKRRTYIFSGLIVCYSCGRIMTGCPINSKSKNGTPHTYYGYRCHRHYDPVSHCDGIRARFESTIERRLLEKLPGELEKYILEAEIKEKPKADNAKKRAAVTKKISRLKELYINELISLEEYKADKEKYEIELSALEADDPQTEVKDLSKYKDLLTKDIGALYKTLGREQKQFFWRSILKEIHVSKDGDVKPIFL